MSGGVRTRDIDPTVVTPRECRAMRLLSDDGWTCGELEMTFQTSQVQRHVTGECNHDHDNGYND